MSDDERDELASTIKSVDIYYRERGDKRMWHERVADAIIAAGYRKPTV